MRRILGPRAGEDDASEGSTEAEGSASEEADVDHGVSPSIEPDTISESDIRTDLTDDEEDT